jgi:hypothetical protein
MRTNFFLQINKQTKKFKLKKFFKFCDHKIFLIWILNTNINILRNSDHFKFYIYIYIAQKFIKLLFIKKKKKKNFFLFLKK